MKRFIAYCGLDCSKCDAYIATINNDQSLREKTAKFWSALNNIPIPPEQINCQGCRMDGVKTIFCENICAIRQCALKKGVDTCSACSSVENCKTIQSFLSKNAKNFKSSK